MFKIVSVTMTLLLLAGCTSKDEKALMEVYEKNKTYHKQLIKTEKIQLYEDGITKVLLTATYLYDAKRDKKQQKDEVFIIGMRVDTDISDGLRSNAFKLTLDGVAPKSIKPLKKQSPLLKEISFTSEWSRFYLVHFPYMEKKSFKVIVSSDRYGKGTLNFAKVAKYVLN